jgi:hypothetical protein
MRRANWPVGMGEELRSFAWNQPIAGRSDLIYEDKVWAIAPKARRTRAAKEGLLIQLNAIGVRKEHPSRSDDQHSEETKRNTQDG